MASDPLTSAGFSCADRSSSGTSDGGPSQGLSHTAPPPGPQVFSSEHYLRFILQQDPWKPHPLSPEEIQNVRRQCSKLLRTCIRQRAYVRLLLKDQPVDTSEEHEQYALTLIAYQVIYWRTFRIYDLPREILSNIIRFVVWSPPSPPIGTRWRLQLTWVSRYFRNIAISDSTLWNAIWFCDNPPFERSLAFIERSRTSPLDLCLNDTPTHKFTDQEICALLKNLTPHLNHIRVLIILFEDWEPILSVLKWLSDYGREGVPPLTMERLEIHRTGNPYLWPGLVWRGTKFVPVNHSISLYSLFGGRYVPELKSFTMNGINIDWENTPSLNNLTTLDLRRVPLELCPPVSCFRRILATSPMLMKLSLDGAGPASSNPTTISTCPAINLLHLHTLVLANFVIPLTKSIISHFTAPNLKDLSIMYFKGVDYGPFYEFMIGRFQKIKLLTLHSASCPIDVLPVMIKWLDSMPLLTCARLSALEHDILRAFLFNPHTMKVHPDTCIVSPRLNVLTVENLQPEIFAKFVLARKLCGIPVKKTYMAQTMAKDFGAAALADISQDIDSLITRVDIGAKIREEEELLNEP
ncbi:hypothetical protein F5878DRAFT_542702 [Lentinula raphanica]|uniref:F-box domain-containing protein n=1 Tax=Lentinula raphanica TaxID=153919 RepID=A0AA38P3V4_9AGAR|nr:hypothetical protein F5878DRAFT_542702 [Lentinula raphanica]